MTGHHQVANLGLGCRFRFIEPPERKCNIGNVTDERVSQSLSCELSVSMKQVINDLPSSIQVLELRADFGYGSLVHLRDDYQ